MRCGKPSLIYDFSLIYLNSSISNLEKVLNLEIFPEPGKTQLRTMFLVHFLWKFPFSPQTWNIQYGAEMICDRNDTVQMLFGCEISLVYFWRLCKHRLWTVISRAPIHLFTGSRWALHIRPPQKVTLWNVGFSPFDTFVTFISPLNQRPGLSFPPRQIYVFGHFGPRPLRCGKD